MAGTFQISQLFLEQTVLENVLIAISARDGFLAGFTQLEKLTEVDEVHSLLDMVGLDDVVDQTAIVLPEGKRKLLDITLALAL